MSHLVDEAFFTRMVELEGRNEEAEDFLSEDENPVKNCPKSWVTFGDTLLASARKAAEAARLQEEPPRVQPSDFGEPELSFSATQPPRSMDQPVELPKVEVPEGFPRRQPATPELPESLVKLETSPEVEGTSGQEQEIHLRLEDVAQEIEKRNRAMIEKNQQPMTVLQANFDIFSNNSNEEIDCGSTRFQVLVEEKPASADESNPARTSGGKSQLFFNLSKEHGVFVRSTGEAGTVVIQLANDTKPLFTGPLGSGIHLSIDNFNSLRLKAPLPNKDHKIERRPIGFSSDCVIAISVDGDSQIHLEKS